jgi:hypothetical protein
MGIFTQSLNLGSEGNQEIITTESAVESMIHEETTSEAPATEVFSQVDEAGASIEQDTSDAVVGQTMTFKRPASAKTYQVINQLDRFRRHDRCVQALHTSLDQLQLVTSLAQVAKERNLSEPLVAAFTAVPGFSAALESFPSQDVFNVIPEHSTTPNNVLGLEAFDTATTASLGTLATRTTDMVNAFGATLNGLTVTVDSLMGQLHDDREDLDRSDMTNDVMQDLPVMTMSKDAFATVLDNIEQHLRAVETFSSDQLRANPEQIKNEVEGIQNLVTQLGQVLGLAMGDHGLVESDKGGDYQPSPGSFGDKQIDKEGLVFLLSKADSVLDALKAIAERKDDLVAAMSAEAGDMPTALDSDDVTYGCTEHVTLMSCYSTYVTKLVREAVLSVSMLLSTVDSVLDINDGLDA